jgi:xylan 1,4-beta-xylosidase
MTTRFTCDASAKPRALPHFWEYCVGSGRAALALRADWQAQLKQCHEELGFRHVRFHGLLGDDMGTLTEHKDELLYSFHNIDRIHDFLRSIDMRPMVELSFMPRALSSGDQTVFHYRANVTPPADFGQWATLSRDSQATGSIAMAPMRFRSGRSRSGTNRISRVSGREPARIISVFSKPPGRH